MTQRWERRFGECLIVTKGKFPEQCFACDSKDVHTSAVQDMHALKAVMQQGIQHRMICYLCSISDRNV